MLIMPKFRVSLFSLALMLAVPFAPQAGAKTASRYHRFTTGNCLR